MLAWPKLIGFAVGAFAVGCVVVTGGDLFRGLFTHSGFVIGFASWFAFGLSCFLLALSYPVYRGHNWARLVLVSTVLLASIIVVWFSVGDVIRQHLAVDGDATKITPEEIRSIQREELILRSVSAGAALIILVPLVSLVCILMHSDVVGAFRQRHLRQHPKA